MYGVCKQAKSPKSSWRMIAYKMHIVCAYNYFIKHFICLQFYLTLFYREFKTKYAFFYREFRYLLAFFIAFHKPISPFTVILTTGMFL